MASPNRLAIALLPSDRQSLEVWAKRASLPVATLGRLVFASAIHEIQANEKLLFPVLMGGQDHDVDPKDEAAMIQAGIEAIERGDGKKPATVAPRPAGKASRAKPGKPKKAGTRRQGPAR